MYNKFTSTHIKIIWLKRLKEHKYWIKITKNAYILKYDFDVTWMDIKINIMTYDMRFCNSEDVLLSIITEYKDR